MSSVDSHNVIKPRLLWIEIARILALCSVILQHIPAACPGNKYVLNASLALFFVVAGFFSSQGIRQPGRQAFAWCKNRVITLLYPYVIWNCIYMLLSGAFLQPDGDYLTYILHEFGVGGAPSLTPLWFIRDLMLFTCIGCLLSRIPILLYTLGIVCLFVKSYGTSCQYPSCLMFGDFVIGILLARIPQIVDHWRQLPKSIHWAFVLGFVGLLVVHLLPCNLAFSSITSGIGVASLLSLSIIIESYSSPRLMKFFSNLAQGCFFVYCSHIFVLVMIIGLFESLDYEAPDWVWWSMVPFVYAGSQLLFLLLRRFMPQSLRYLAMIKKNKKPSLG